jgi:hypothetical protein
VSPDEPDFSVASFAVKGICGVASKDSLTGPQQNADYPENAANSNGKTVPKHFFLGGHKRG